MKNYLLRFACAGLFAGCVASGSGQFHSSAAVTMPTMVYIDSDVQVVEDYQEPIFYNSNYYWRNDGGTWYRSSNYQSGWVQASATVPAPILRIQTPAAYVHYHGEAHAGASAGH